MNKTEALAWWQQRPLREKVMLAGGACAALLALGDTLVTAPLEKKLKRAAGEVSSLQTRLQSQRPDAGQVAEAAMLRTQEALWRDRLQLAQASAEQLDRRIADATRLPETLRAIVGTVGSARVLELDLGGDVETQAGPNLNNPLAKKLYRLPITLKVSGNWSELQQLLQQIERHADTLQWSALALDNTEWPAIQLTLKAHVWSHAPRWGASS